MSIKIILEQGGLHIQYDWFHSKRGRNTETGTHREKNAM